MANYGNTESVIFSSQYNKAPLHEAYNAHNEDDDEDAYEDYSDGDKFILIDSNLDSTIFMKAIISFSLNCL